jgi:enamine deaminase RidA (YjgF/YER057c/UK114 family)
MKYTTSILNDLSVEIKFSAFNGEYHAVIEGNNPLLDAQTQYRNVEQAVKRLALSAVPVLKRYFVSDAVNHEAYLPKADAVAVSVVQQPPLSGAKVALWAYFVENAKTKNTGENAIAMQHSAYTHLFDMQLHNHHKDEFAQTEDLFNNYTQKLHSEGCTLKDNAVRTWIYVQGVDTHYADMVKARKLHFYEQGLTENTHYIASTGIEGKYIHPETTVLMDSYAVKGICDEQVTYLKGATHLNPTHEYGVTFERATAVDYGDRRHIFVSGTASIDNKGEILFPLNIAKQTDRTLENIEVLLQEGGAAMQDIAQMIVYLRDTADYQAVCACLETKYPNIPKVIVWAPVCRQGWLIEMECIAVKAIENKAYAVF